MVLLARSAQMRLQRYGSQNGTPLRDRVIDRVTCFLKINFRDNIENGIFSSPFIFDAKHNTCKVKNQQSCTRTYPLIVHSRNSMQIKG